MQKKYVVQQQQKQYSYHNFCFGQSILIFLLKVFTVKLNQDGLGGMSRVIQFGHKNLQNLQNLFLFGLLLSYFPHLLEKINNFHKKQTTRQNRKRFFFLIRIFILNIYGFFCAKSIEIFFQQQNWYLFQQFSKFHKISSCTYSV